MARRSRFVRPPPRTKMWIGSGVGSTTVTGAVDALISSLLAGALALRPFTILRTRMHLQYTTDQKAADEFPIGSYGELVVTETAAAVGISAIPSPSGISGDPEADWYVWQALSTAIIFGSGVAFDANAGSHFDIDSKAMRKVGPDDDVVAVYSNEGAAGIRLVTNGRQLIQLH